MGAYLPSRVTSMPSSPIVNFTRSAHRPSGSSTMLGNSHSEGCGTMKVTLIGSRALSGDSALIIKIG